MSLSKEPLTQRREPAGDSSRIRFVEHAGKQILWLDFSNATPEQYLELIQQTAEVVRRQPKASVLTLTDATRARYNMEVTQALRDLVAGNKPFVKAAAVVGAEGLGRVVVQGLRSSSRRPFATFETVEEARDYLVSAG